MASCRGPSAKPSTIPSASTSGLNSVAPSPSTPQITVRKSAYCPAKYWTRDPQPESYEFSQLLVSCASNFNISVQVNRDPLEILIARNRTCHTSNPGFLGMGSSKVAIYVSLDLHSPLVYHANWPCVSTFQGRINGREYAISQPLDSSLPDSEVRNLLVEELKLLAKCDAFKAAFDDYVKTYFNDSVFIPCTSFIFSDKRHEFC